MPAPRTSSRLGIIPMGRQSSAYGYSQALDGTWEEYQKDQRRRGAKRDRIDDATDFMGWYMDETYERLGIPMSDARNQYLAYHEGRTGLCPAATAKALADGRGENGSSAASRRCTASCSLMRWRQRR